jgi:hypothetical protein
MPTRTAAALMMTITLTGCSAMHGNPENPTKNPNPLKRYEVTVTADAPGPWDAVKGYLPLEVVNVECVPEDKLTGGRNVPNKGYDLQMISVDEKTWKGYFYRDALQDEDYFGLGVCHWDATNVGVVFKVHDATFGASAVLGKAGTQKDYFRKSIYEDRSSTNHVAAFSSSNPLVINQPEAFFSLKVVVKEATP